MLCTYNTNALAQKSLSLNGIRSYYVDEEPDGIFGPGHPAYYGDLTVNGLTIQGDVYGVGIAIEGGSAQIDNANIYAQTGIKVTATATEGGKGVQIKNTTVKTCFGQAVKLNATKDIQIDTIEGCKFYGSYDSDKALDITSTAGTTITINKIVDSSFVSPGTAIFVKGASDAAKVTIKEITDCVLAGDRAALNGTGNPATVGLDLQAYAVVEKMMNCTVVASTTNNKATALSVGANCSLNLVCAGEDNNWFAAEGNGESKLFVGSGTVTVQVGTGSPSDGVSATDFDISNTPANFSSATEFHGGYDCYKLVIPKESA